ncbi:MAG: hypothetical protein F7B17_00130 [Desulfurococcales archaeon]|nr:hypothetical protein [Desulfurococcales archaeon]
MSSHDKELEAIIRRARELLQTAPRLPQTSLQPPGRDGRSGLSVRREPSVPASSGEEAGDIGGGLEVLGGGEALRLRLTPLEETRFVQLFLSSLRHAFCRLLERDMFVTQFTVRARQTLAVEGASVRWAAAMAAKIAGERGGGVLAVVHLDTREARAIYVRGRGAGFYVTGEPVLLGGCGSVFDKYAKARGYAFIYHDPDPAV